MEINIPPIDKRGFYAIETFGDDISGAIQRLTPVLADGSPDSMRTVQFKIVTSLQFPNGQMLNVNLLIPNVTTLEGAMDAFTSTLQAHVQKKIQELQDQIRRQSILAGAAAARGPAANERLPRR